jgi:hypothetical protein
MAAVNGRARLVSAAVGAALLIAGCGSSGGHATSPTTSPPATTPAPAGAAPTTPAAAASLPTGAGSGRRAATCPSVGQASAALGVTYTNLTRSPVDGIGTVCEYTGGASGNAGATIFAHETPAVFAGQVANAGRSPGMRPVTGIGDGAFGLTAGGRSIVNAYSNASRTFVAAQSPQATAATEALARVALADN